MSDPALQNKSRSIRIGILTDVPFSVVNGSLFTVKDGRLMQDNRPVEDIVRPERQPRKMSNCEGTSYRGNLIVEKHGGAITVINELSVDTYLKGVLTRESNATWPAEALKAQAVTSRTFAVGHFGRHRKDRYDLCVSTHCQMYGGTTGEDQRINAAVDATRGEILTYQGMPISAYFFASCGGATESVGVAWGGETQPYLQGKKCKWCKDAPTYRWELKLGSGDIMISLLKRNLVVGSRLESVFVDGRTPSGRAQSMVVKTDSGTFTVPAVVFRVAMGGDRLLSTLFDVVPDKEGLFRFSGGGWGHGIGLCQWGARGQALIETKYRDILEYYYPGTKIFVWNQERK